jgi:hypothetical protein
MSSGSVPLSVPVSSVSASARAAPRQSNTAKAAIESHTAGIRMMSIWEQ